MPIQPDLPHAAPSSMALYIHVPFCARRCAYCHFEIKVVHPSRSPIEQHRDYVAHLIKEIAHCGQHTQKPLHSMYFGGGTPSRLGADHLDQIMAAVKSNFELLPSAEITLECNPEDVSRTFLARLQAAGINRISMGVQTFHQPSLFAIGRIHDNRQAREALVMAKEVGFKHGVSMDLMLGLPYQNQQTLAFDLEQVLAIQPQHLSVYMLERDLPTPLDKLGRNLPMPDEDQQADAFEQVVAALHKGGWQHYEISNFSEPGHESRHNLTYWNCGDYLGIGPAAHSRIGLTYSQNAAQLRPWLQRVADKGRGQIAEEHWSSQRLEEERQIQGLRLLRQGIPWDTLSQTQRTRLQEPLEHQLLERIDKRLVLTTKGCLLANEVFERLMAH